MSTDSNSLNRSGAEQLFRDYVKGPFFFKASEGSELEFECSKHQHRDAGKGDGAQTPER